MCAKEATSPSSVQGKILMVCNYTAEASLKTSVPFLSLAGVIPGPEIICRPI